ncbi:sensor histidine kinase [Pedobacter mucosus]|uniref:sensor histidine kinase n=1 Tax=Pedobacter mucosus TaxID=2895286 RepID=UPI001EE4635C|nr:histidine kinase [Pedobacter mucosus]UKT63159.1 histidine kinase [Pedobacter mucosus]
MNKNVGFQILIQIIAAIFILTLPLFIISGQDLAHILSFDILFPYLIFCSFFIGIYLLHTYILLPKLYKKKNYVSYFLSLILILSLLVTTRPFDRFIFKKGMRPDQREMPKPPDQFRRGNPPHREEPGIDIVSIFLLLIIIVISIIKETNKQLQETTKRALQAEAEKAQADLSFLKAQVNPHFLFNTLNNIYTLAIIKDDHTGPSILKLSNIMRYITDEANNDFVNLQNEVDCITDFISIQKLRLTKKTTLEYNLEGTFERQKIAPLILMAFVENVFKYGISNHNNGKLIVGITLLSTSINFYSKNAIYPDKKHTERTGIGIENTKKRLQHTYPNKHILNIKDDDGFFTVNLTIHL